MKKSILKKYAKLIAVCGVNVRRGQEVVIRADLDQPEFVKMLVDECYKAGAKKVSVEFSYQPLIASHFKYCSEDTLSKLENWEIEKWEHKAAVLPCLIYLLSEDPDGLSGIDQGKYARCTSAQAKTVKPIRARMENRYQWCIAAVPGKAWAKKLFPNLSASQAVEKLWEAILISSRVTDDPILEWKEHNENLKRRCEYLNSLKIRSLKFKSENGTDLSIGLIPDALFAAGGEYTLGTNIFFNPNIPSEETFTSPMKGEADGIVYSTLPLSYGGQLIENFYLKFENGKVVESGAEKNAELLREIISMDEGAAYLGEVALVPHSSPIRKLNVTFYNTLFDENASCHLAIGKGFTNLLRDYESITEEEAHKKGINDSVIHIDFMIGAADLDVTAFTEDGKEVSVFRRGEWAF